MPKKVTAVLGDFYHRKDIAIQSLEVVIDQLDEQIDINYLSVNELTDNLKEDPDVVILFAENRLNPEDETVKTWMSKEVATKINEYVANGGSWFAWHSGLASYDNIKEYTYLVKGYFIHHPEDHQVVTYTTSGDANVVQPNLSFEFLDEHYFVHVEEDETNVFLRSSSVDGTSLAGWKHTYGDGKVMCLIPAHLEEGLLNSEFLKIFSQALKWSLHSSN